MEPSVSICDLEIARNAICGAVKGAGVDDLLSGEAEGHSRSSDRAAGRVRVFFDFSITYTKA
jgi:hypothetical protein